MNMRLPRYLVDSDPLLTNVVLLLGEDPALEVSDTEWTAEELENAEQQVEAVLMEEALIEACFEEMMEEEEDRWFHNHVIAMQPPVYLFTPPSQAPLQQLSSSTLQYVPVWLSMAQTPTENYSSTNVHCEHKYFLVSQLNPEAPEFYPHSMMS
ncbi:uncharacterized protein LOC127843116 [Dreissena polymorpha]|uniref:Uncharacterized protein n=1 Tax=Dreissena polymorpha TaxID=45954 RepID=A0A9D4EVX5_DREPO|nr:uncharacterized protein LOC127843116 [Dreissena polymorpha]KAH3787227.1 hypothetical protein DPMN_165347 [Dreissena polymorpha]